MNSKQKRISLAVAAAAATALAGLATASRADNVTWVGTTDNLWATSANWSTGALPTSADDVFFYQPGATFLDLTLVNPDPANDANRDIHSLTFTADATSTVTITAGASTANQRLSIIGASGTILDVQAGSHIIAGVNPVSPNQELRLGPTSSAGGPVNLNVADGAQLELNARLQAGNSQDQYHKTGGGTLIISGGNGGSSGWNFSNTHGGMVIDQGVLVMTSTSAFGNSSDRFTVNNGAVLELHGGYGSTNGGAQSWNDGGIIRATGADMGFNNGSGSVNLSGTPIIDVVDNTFTISQDMGGTGNVFKQGAGTLVLNGPNTYTGSTIASEGVLQMGASGNIDTSPVIDVRSGATFDVTPLGTYNVANNQTLGGQGTVVGNVNVSNSSAAIAPGLVGTAGTLTLANDLNLGGGSVKLDLANVTTVGGDVNDIIDIAGALNLSGTTALAINRLNGTLSPGTYTIMKYAGALGGTASNLLVPTVRQGLTVDLNTSGEVNLTVGAGSPMSLTWSGDGSSNVWDLNTTSNFNAGAQKFFDWDTVTFDDTGSNSPDINVSGTLQPDTINLSNSAKSYNLTGGGALINVVNVNKSGSGVATFSNSGPNSFTNMTVGAGTLALANNSSVASLTVNGGVFQMAPGFNGIVNAGAVNSGGQVLLTSNGTFGALSIASGGTLSVGDGLGANPSIVGNIADDGVTLLNRTDDYTLSANFSGAGQIQKLGNGTATMSGDNSGFTGELLVSSGGLRVSNSNSLGSGAAGTVTLLSGTTLDIAGPAANSLSFGARVFRIAGTGTDGNGVLVNTGPNNQQNAFQQVVLTGDATVGGNTRFDIRGGTPVLDLGGFTLTKTGDMQLSLVGVNVTDGNINVNQGTLSVETTSVVPDFATGTKITMAPGTALQFFSNTATISTVTRPVVFTGGGLINNASGADSIIGSPISMGGDIDVTGSATTPGDLVLTGNITETGGAHILTKDSDNALILAGTNNWTGGTNINTGTIQVGAGGTTGTIGSGPINNNGTLAFNRTDTLTVASDIGGGGAVYQQGTGTTILSGNNSYGGVTTVQAGKLVLMNNAKNPVLSGAGADVQGGRLVLDYSDTGTSLGPQVLSILDAGFDQSPKFNSGQIRTSTPEAADKGLGWKDDTAAKQVTVGYTYYGDANLDGQVDVTDLGALATNWQTSNVWAGGDFNYDGFVDVTDLGALATNWQKGVGSPLGAGSLEAALQSVGLGNVSVPEPASIGVIGICLAAAASRRRTRRGRRG